MVLSALYILVDNILSRYNNWLDLNSGELQMPYEFSWFGVTNTVSFFVAVFLASFVLKTNPKKDSNRIFALMFIVISVVTLSGALFEFSEPKERIWQDVRNFSFFPVYGLLVYFVSIFPRRYTIFGTNRYATILLFVPCFVGWILYFLYSSLFISGLIWNIVTAVSLFYAILVLVRSYVHAVTDIELKQIKYILAAFAIQGTFFAFLFLSLLITFLSVAVMPASVLVDILFVVLVAYAILKFQLFDIEVKVKRSVKYIMVTAVLIASLLFINELVETFLLESLFSGEITASILTACMVGVLFIPVERLCRRGVNKLFPKVRESEEHYHFKKEEVYRATLEEAWVDGTLTEKEKMMLKSLREKLGLSEEEHNKIETEVKKGFKLDQETPSTPPGSIVPG